MPTTIQAALAWMLGADGVVPRTLGWRFHPDSNSLTIKGYESATMKFEFEVDNLRRIRKQLGLLAEDTN